MRGEKVSVTPGSGGVPGPRAKRHFRNTSVGCARIGEIGGLRSGATQWRRCLAGKQQTNRREGEAEASDMLNREVVAGPEVDRVEQGEGKGKKAERAGKRVGTEYEERRERESKRG